MHANAMAGNTENSFGMMKGTPLLMSAITTSEIKNLLDLTDPSTFFQLLDFAAQRKDQNAVKLIQYFSGAGATSLPDIAKPAEPCKYQGKDPNMIMICSGGFFSLKDEQIDDYVALSMARWVCKMGFDGWVIGGEYKHAGANGDDFAPEIMLCNMRNVKFAVNRNMRDAAD